MSMYKELHRHVVSTRKFSSFVAILQKDLANVNFHACVIIAIETQNVHKQFIAHSMKSIGTGVNAECSQLKLKLNLCYIYHCDR